MKVSHSPTGDYITLTSMEVADLLEVSRRTGVIEEINLIMSAISRAQWRPQQLLNYSSWETFTFPIRGNENSMTRIIGLLPSHVHDPILEEIRRLIL